VSEYTAPTAGPPPSAANPLRRAVRAVSQRSLRVLWPSSSVPWRPLLHPPLNSPDVASPGERSLTVFSSRKDARGRPSSPARCRL